MILKFMASILNNYLHWLLFLKSNHTKGDYSVNGRIEISSDEDIQVIDGNNVERIKIGLLDVTKNKDDTYTGHYGIRITDNGFTHKPVGGYGQSVRYIAFR